MSEEAEIKALLGCEKTEDFSTYLVRLGSLETNPSIVAEVAHIKTNNK